MPARIPLHDAPHSDLLSVCGRLANAVQELQRLADESVSGSDAPCSQVMSLLQRVRELEQEGARAVAACGGAAEASQVRGEWPAAVARYGELLADTIRLVGVLEGRLSAARRRLAPQLDAAAREQQMRSAYARASS